MKLKTEEFNQIRSLVHKLSGLALSPDKEYLVQTRLEPIVRKYSMNSFSEIAVRLQGGNDRVFQDEIVGAMTTNETSFNRDGHPFEVLRSSILPLLLRLLDERRSRNGIPFPRIRIWSVAASTGQEPYSIAMAILDFLAHSPGTDWKSEHFWILGTDISEQALQVARVGRYSDWELERGLAPDQKTKFFSPREQFWEISPAVRKLVEFRRLNILDNVANLTGFDVVFCRNLLIYFDEATRQAVCQKLANSLNLGGILLIGAAEHLPATSERMFKQQSFGKTIGYVRI